MATDKARHYVRLLLRRPEVSRLTLGEVTLVEFPRLWAITPRVFLRGHGTIFPTCNPRRGC